MAFTETKDDQALRAWGELFTSLAPAIILLGIIGIGTIMGLLFVWRRYNRRLGELGDRSDSARDPDLHADVWASAGQRLDPPHKRPRPPSPELIDHDEDFPQEDEDDDDEDAPWRESLDDVPDFDEEDEDDWDEGGDAEDEPRR